MVDVATIVIAIVSLVSSLISVAFTGWITYFIERVKQKHATQALTSKYRDPLMQSAQELQMRLHNIVRDNFLWYLRPEARDEGKQDLVVLGTAFLVGQYFSWVYIFRRRAQFLRFATDKTNRRMNETMDRIAQAFSTDRMPRAFMLWRPQQLAIGERMIISKSSTEESEGKELYCMGFAEFTDLWHRDESFRAWFATIENDFDSLLRVPSLRTSPEADRLRVLQHLLVDLVSSLGGEKVVYWQSSPGKLETIPQTTPCTCTTCPQWGDKRTSNSKTSPARREAAAGLSAEGKPASRRSASRVVPAQDLESA